MVQKGRSYGTWRAILDLSEAIRHELGPNSCAYSDAELDKILKTRPPIKFHIEGPVEGVAHITLSSEADVNEKLSLDWEQEYGKASE